MARVTEIGADVFRISSYVPALDLQFNQFLVRDDEPLLVHTGQRALFRDTRAAVAEVLDPATVRWIAFSHFEADECGALADWQAVAPHADAVCSVVAKHVSVDDVLALRPSRGMDDGELLETGAHRFRFLRTPHVPHGWDAGLLHDETEGVLFASDLLFHYGDVEARTSGDVLGRCEDALRRDLGGPFADAFVADGRMVATLRRLSELEPRVLAAMHGSSYEGDGGRVLGEYAGVLGRVLGGGV